MNNHHHENKSNVKWTEAEARTVSNLTAKLNDLEKKIGLIQTESQTSLNIRTEDIQKMSAEINVINALVDSIEVEISQLSSRIREIEFLRFKHRSRD